MRILRELTTVKVPIGPFVDKDDGITPQTDIILSDCDRSVLLKHGASSITNISDNTWAAITNADGMYNLTLTSDETDTVGIARVYIDDVSETLSVIDDFMVMPSDVYDALYGSSDMKAVSSVTGNVTIDLSQAISESPANKTVGESLYYGLANGKYKLEISGTSMTLYKSDGATTATSWTLDDATNPTSRTPA